MQESGCCGALRLLGKVVETVAWPACTRGDDLGVSRMSYLASPPSNAEIHTAMQRALAAGRIGTWHWDIASDAVLWDGTLCAVYGLSAAEAPRTAPDFLGLVTPEDRDVTVRNVSHALEGAATVEHRFRASVGGRTFSIHDRAHVIHDGDGRSTSMIGMCCGVGPESSNSIAPVPGPMGEHRPIELAAYLGTLVESLRRDPQTGVERLLQYESAQVECTFDYAVKIGLILLELVAPVGVANETASGRRVGITLEIGARSGRLRITDNGAGRLAGAQSDIATDIGIQSAGALAGRIGGTLTSDDAGAAHYFGSAHLGRLWRLEFPLPGGVR